MSRLETVALKDFTGGLNYRADAYQLADNESPDMLNVDIDPRGGFSQRNGIKDYNASAIGSIAGGSFDPHRVFAWDGNTRQLFVAANNKVFWTETDAFADMGVTTDSVDGAEFGAWSNSGTSYIYGSAGASNDCFRWDGTGASQMETEEEELPSHWMVAGVMASQTTTDSSLEVTSPQPALSSTVSV